VARAAVDALRCPVGDQSAFGQCDGATAANIRHMVGKPIAGKTGTTDGNMTATLITMTKQLAVGGILADPDWPTTTRLVHDVGGRDPHAGVVNPAVGETLHDFMVGKPAIDFTAPPRKLAFGKGSGMPNVTCQSVSSATSKLRGAGFKVTVDRTPITSKCPAGTVAQANLSGGSGGSAGTVTLLLSNGGGAAPPTQGGGRPPVRIPSPPGRGGHG
jgi:membrane peptidoglycan carboxypeptidase